MDGGSGGSGGAGGLLSGLRAAEQAHTRQMEALTRQLNALAEKQAELSELHQTEAAKLAEQQAEVDKLVCDGVGVRIKMILRSFKFYLRIDLLSRFLT